MENAHFLDYLRLLYNKDLEVLENEWKFYYFNCPKLVLWVENCERKKNSELLAQKFQMK